MEMLEIESKDNNCLLEIIKLGKSRVERDLVSRQHSFSNPFLIDGMLQIFSMRTHSIYGLISSLCFVPMS